MVLVRIHKVVLSLGDYIIVVTQPAASESSIYLFHQNTATLADFFTSSIKISFIELEAYSVP